MSFIAISIFVRASIDVSAAIERAERAVEQGARLVEWRIDKLAEQADGKEAAKELVRRSPAPCIVTCRSATEGGSYRDDEVRRTSIMSALLESDDPPRYIDYEHAIFEALPDALDPMISARGRETSLILSAHDFDGRPADLLQRIEAMARNARVSVCKVAWHARSLRDNLEAFDLLAERRMPTIALCMGPFGLMSRVLAPKFGGLLTFATDDPASATAEGQPTVEELVDLYGYESIGAATRVYGVIGWPVAHSLGPAFHNAAFRAIEHDAVYLPMPVPPEYEHFKATVGAMIDHSRLDFRGASVTIPHKEHLLRFIEERGGRVDETAARIGAANTLIAGSAGTIACENTDSPAAVAALCDGMHIEPAELAGKRIVVIGAGGVARAVIGGLLDVGADVTISSRTPERAKQLSEQFADLGPVTICELQRLLDGSFDIYVNCTPIGMAGGDDPDGLPIPEDAPLDEHTTVFDTVYTPVRTPLVESAQARGARVVTGMDMFMRQAAMQFERWTGRPAPLEVLRDRLEAAVRD